MSATSTKGLTVYLTKGEPTKISLVPTAVSAANPAVVTVADVTGVTKDDLVTFADTGFAALDGKTFVVGTVDDTANTFEVVGGDTSGSTETLGGSPKAEVIQATDRIKLCLATVEPSTETPGTTPVGTFCDPSATLPSSATSAGTITMTGYVDTSALSGDGYKELLKATEDGKERILEVILPQGLGYIVAPVTLASISWALPLDGAIGFTAAGALGSKPRHLFS